jgi:hypothetical protein
MASERLAHLREQHGLDVTKTGAATTYASGQIALRIALKTRPGTFRS